jgi:hypothetical protein
MQKPTRDNRSSVIRQSLACELKFDCIPLRHGRNNLAIGLRRDSATPIIKVPTHRENSHPMSGEADRLKFREELLERIRTAATEFSIPLSPNTRE